MPRCRPTLRRTAAARAEHAHGSMDPTAAPHLNTFAVLMTMLCGRTLRCVPPSPSQIQFMQLGNDCLHANSLRQAKEFFKPDERFLICMANHIFG